MNAASGRRMTSDAWRLGAALLIGSVPFSNIIARVALGQDLRRVGNGTVSPSNLYQVGGIGPFTLACALDISKGALAAALLRQRGMTIAAMTAGLTLAGHNWSLFQRGAGGRGVLPATGILLVAAPSGATLLAGGVVAGYVTGDTAPGCFVAQLTLVPVLAASKGHEGALLGLALVVPMLAKRLLGNDWLAHGRSRQTSVTRMIYDRDTRSGSGEDGAAYGWHNRLAQGQKPSARTRRTRICL